MNPLIEKTATALNAHGFDVYTVENGLAARDLVLSLIGKNESITFGGSATVNELGVTDALKSGGYLVYDRMEVPPAERLAFSREHFFSDWFLMGSNAITEEGELLNLDGNGNRVAALIFGPKNVIVVAGINKIVPDMPSAYERVRKVAAPRNAQRFPLDTPCKKTGACADCLSPDTICAQFVRTRVCKPRGRIKVILVNENLGF